MADNTDLNPGVDGDKMVTREVSHGGDTAKLQGVFLMGVSGTEGAYTVAAIDGDAANGVDVDVTRLPALAAGTNNIGDVDVLTLPALPAGTNNIGDVDVLTLPNVTLAAGTNTNEVVGDVAHDAPAAGNPLLMAGYASAAAPTDVSADADAVRAWHLRNGAQATVITAAGALIGGDATNGLDVDVTRLPALVAGTANIGDVDVLTLPALPAGTNNIGDVDVLTIAAGDNNIGNVDIVTMPNVTLAAGTNTNEVVGDVAHDAPAAGNPVLIAGYASAAAPTDVSADADAVRAWHLRNGAQATVLTAAGALIGGDATNGLDVDVTRLPALAAGTNNIGDVDVLTIAAGDNNIGNVDIVTMPNVTLAAGTNTNEVVGDVAHDAPAAGNPLLIAGYASAAAPTDVSADADAVRAWFLKNGAQATVITAAGALVGGDATNGLDVDVTRLPALVAGTANIGDVDVLTLPALPAGTNNIGDVDVLTIAAGDNNIGNVDIVTMPNVTLAAGTNTNEVVGDVAHDAPAAGNPLLIAGYASAAAPTDVSADADAVRAWFLKNGAQATVLTAAGALVGGDATNGLDVDVTRLPALVAGTANIGDVDVLTLPALPAGTNNIGDVDVLTLPNVTLAAGTNTNEVVGDVAHDAPAAGNPLLMAGYASAAAPTDVSADADAVRAWFLRNGAQATVITAAGALVGGDAANGLDVDVTRLPALVAGTANIGDVDVLTLPALPAGTNNIGDVDVLTLPNVTLAAGTNTNEVVGDVAHDAPAAGNPLLMAGYASAAAPTDVSADADAVRAWHLRNGAQATVITAAGALIGGDAANGLDVDVTRLPALVAGTANIGDVDIVTMPNVTLAAGTNTNEIVGDVAHDSPIGGNPVRTGGRALTADFTAVATGDTTDFIATTLGKQVIVRGAIPALTESYASPSAVTDTADDEAFAAGTGSERHYVTGVQVFNGHDTVGTEVVIKDGSTVKWRGWAEQTGGGCSAQFDPPLRGTAATAVNVANITTGSSTYFNLQGYKAAE